MALQVDGVSWAALAAGTSSTNGRSALFVEMGYDRAVIASDYYKYLRAGQGDYTNKEASSAVLSYFPNAGPRIKYR